MARGSRKGDHGIRSVPSGGAPPKLFDPEAILATLRSHGVAFVVIGAYAAVTQGWSEPTSDIDINLERVIASKRACDRPKDRDVVPRLEALLQRLREGKS